MSNALSKVEKFKLDYNQVEIAQTNESFHTTPKEKPENYTLYK